MTQRITQRLEELHVNSCQCRCQGAIEERKEGQEARSRLEVGVVQIRKDGGFLFYLWHYWPQQ